MARSRHTPKRPDEQAYYVEQVSRLGYEPTVSEEPGSPAFTNSDELEEPTVAPTRRRRRPRGWGEGVTEHFRRNGAAWITAVVTLLIGGLLWFSMSSLFDLKGAVERLGAAIEGINKDISTQGSDIKDVQNAVHDQELKLQEQRIKIDYLEKQPGRTP